MRCKHKNTATLAIPGSFPADFDKVCTDCGAAINPETGRWRQSQYNKWREKVERDNRWMRKNRLPF